MKWDYEWRRRAVRRHRVVFKGSALVGLAGASLCVLGLAYAASGHNLSMLALGMMLLGAAGLNAYRIVLATVKIVELDQREGISTLHAP